MLPHEMLTVRSWLWDPECATTNDCKCLPICTERRTLQEQVLDPKQRVSFLDTSVLPSACERLAGDHLSNPGEANIIMLIVQSLQGVGVPTGSIGVISPYRSQVSSVPPFTVLSPSYVG